MKTTRVLLADDHVLVRAGIRLLLEKMTGIEVVTEAGDGREALELTKKHLPNVVLMDIAIPGLNGLEALARRTKEFSAVKVIILSMYANEEYVLQALRAGACGYLLKDAAVAELELALRAVTRGETSNIIKGSCDLSGTELEVIEQFARIGESLKAGSFKQQFLVTVPAPGLDQVIVQRPILVRVSQVQRARFNAVLNMSCFCWASASRRSKRIGRIDGALRHPRCGRLRARRCAWGWYRRQGSPRPSERCGGKVFLPADSGIA
jgi:CheY-like chemotaxis protein